MNGRMQNHENRINKVETDCDTMKGKAAIIGGAIGFVGSLIGFAIMYFKNRFK